MNLSIAAAPPEPGSKLLGPSAIRERLRGCLIVPPDMLCGEVAERFRRSPEAECAVVCGENRRPLGLLMKHRFFRSIGSTFGVSLFSKKEVSLLMDQELYTAEADAVPRELIDGALGRSGEAFYNAVVVTDGGVLAGVLTVRDLLDMSRLLQREAAESQIRTVSGTEEMIRDIHRALEKVMAATDEMQGSSEKITEATGQGKRELEDMLLLFRQWSEHARLQEQAMREMTEGAAAVAQVAKLIADLADQCNLLAVNAAIEAARAGEYGRGFGVVAQDIRKLADGTKRSAGDIRRMLQSMSEAVARTDKLVKEGKQSADQGARQVSRSEETFARLWAMSERNREAALQLGAASAEAVRISEHVREQFARFTNELNGNR